MLIPPRPPRPPPLPPRPRPPPRPPPPRPPFLSPRGLAILHSISLPQTCVPFMAAMAAWASSGEDYLMVKTPIPE